MPDVAPGFRLAVASTVVRIFKSKGKLKVPPLVSLLGADLKVEANGVTGRKVGSFIAPEPLFH